MLTHNFAVLARLKNVSMDDPDLLTVSQAAEAFSATSQSIRNWIRAGRLHSVRIGHRFLIPREEVERLRGETGKTRGESTWDYTGDQPAEPLRRRTSAPAPAADPAEGLLGA